MGKVLNSIFDLQGRKVLASTGAAFAIGLMSASGAFADTPSMPAYGGSGGSEQGTVDQGLTAPTDTTPPPAQEVLGTRQGGGTAPGGSNEVLPATTPSGNEVLGANANGGSLPTNANGSAPAAVTAPASAHATHRLVGNLPFTGLDIGLLAMAGLGLAGLGLALRKLTAHSPQAG